MLPPLPGWIVSAPSETPEAAAFRSGAALAYLGQAMASGDVPLALWRDRLALAAAGNCAAMAGRREAQSALRDALHLTGPGVCGCPLFGKRTLRFVGGLFDRTCVRPLSVAFMTPRAGMPFGRRGSRRFRELQALGPRD